MDRLADEAGDDDFPPVEKMIRHGLLSEANVTNTTDTGNEYKTTKVSLYRSGVRLSKRVKFVERDTFAAGGFAAFKGRMISAVTAFLSNKYKLKIESPGGAREGDGEYPITPSIDDPGSPVPGRDARRRLRRRLHDRGRRPPLGDRLRRRDAGTGHHDGARART